MKIDKTTKILTIVLGILFIWNGLGKFLVPDSIANPIFDHFFGKAGQYFTGVYQLIAAVLVLVPATAFIGATLLAITMAIAFVLHLTVIGFAPGIQLVATILSLVFLVLAIIVMVRTKDGFLDLIKKA